jgi:1,4-dihydroxy-2-naphthoate octaprenyltransferase
MVIAWNQGYSFNWGVGILSILAVILIMLATYYSGEYYDYDTDSLNREYNKFSGGTRVLQAGLIPRKRVLLAARLALAAAGIIGLVLQFYFKTGPFTIPLGLFGMLCGYFYTSKPARWAYRGVGEILIGICYGWLTVNTGYYLQTGTFGLIPTLVSIPIGISIFLVILINEFPDYTSDRASGKNNLVVRLGRDRAARLYAGLAALCFLSIVLGVLAGIPRLMAVLSIIPLGLIVRNLLALRKRGYREGRTLERICSRTLLLNLGTTALYILVFVL